MHVQQQYRSEAFNRSGVKMYSATHARSEFPLSSELRSKESESIKRQFFTQVEKWQSQSVWESLCGSENFALVLDGIGRTDGWKSWCREDLRKRCRSKIYTIRHAKRRIWTLGTKHTFHRKKCKNWILEPFSGFRSPNYIKQRVWWGPETGIKRKDRDLTRSFAF